MKQIGQLYKKIYEDKSWLTISNLLTILRIILTPIIVVLIFFENWSWSFSLFIIASLTDLLDGYLSRLLNQKTYLGAFLDPIADKFFLMSVFFSFAFFHSPKFWIPAWFIGLIFCREFIILIGSYLLIRSDVGLKIKPTIFGKLTTMFQSLFIGWIFICYFFNWLPQKTHYFLLVFVTIFSLLSLFTYVRLGLKYLSRKV